ncbi:MAG: hypothetical protein NC904_03225, partial [Candidatus Omnitrophica bacterium]|nr:hypothetical protein [Candidatus Omnitrophota bacterium]
MNNFITYILKLSGFFSLFFNLFLGIFVYSKNRKNWVNISFLLVSISIGCWSVGSSFINILSKGIALKIERICWSFAVFLPYFLLLFFHFVTSNKNKWVLRISFFVSCIFLIIVPTPLLVKTLSYRFPHYPNVILSEPGILSPLFIIYFSLSVGIGVYWLINMMFRGNSFQRLQAKYLLVSTIVAVISGIEYFSTFMGIKKSPPMDDFILILYFSLMSYAIIRHRLMDIRVAVTKAGIFFILYAIVLGIPFYVGYRTGSW